MTIFCLTPGSLASQSAMPSIKACKASWEALSLDQKLADANPDVARFRKNLATSHHELGHLLSDTGKPAEQNNLRLFDLSGPGIKFPRGIAVQVDTSLITGGGPCTRSSATIAR